MVRMSLQVAITELLNVRMIKGTFLASELGFSDTVMIYRYRKGTVKSCTHKRAYLIYKNYDILIDAYNDPLQLQDLISAEDLASTKEKDKCTHITKKLVAMASLEATECKRSLLKLIAEYA